ncbi:hypothetical protein ACE41O_21330 [Alteromonas macleodii]|jgi:hypothetical protein|uniref:hypothetical protein n=1 Tax=Alteromonas macleodii TaxID=28108 RepID=UPI000C6002A5|nr:hypothetical protein [Alteromonas macleodii]MAW03546.1 hypothetical protein [Alteromonas sp.]|tara:strand:- start:182 stop:1582 length:1401 start_codon:yes stop_codon:yes gene_type:complete
MNKLLLMLFFFMTPFCGLTQTLEIGQQSGDNFTYDSSKQYTVIKLSSINLPEGEDDSSLITRAIKRFALDRKQFGLGYIEVTPEFGEPEKTFLFSYERDSNDIYSYESLGATDGLELQLIRPFIFDGPVTVKIVVQEWEGENNAVIKKIINASNDLSLSTEQITGINSLLSTIETIFPADSKFDAITLQVSPEDIKGSEIAITAAGENFITIELDTTESFFKGFNLHNGLDRAQIRDYKAWQNVISDANKNARNDGLEPLYALARSYSNYVGQLPLNSLDQAILTACSIKDWASDAVNGLEFDGKTSRFSATNYSQLPTADLSVVRGGRCDFYGVDCNNENCFKMSDFINKSSTENARKKAASMYIDGELVITFNNSEIKLTSDEFINSFRIRRTAFFEIENNGPNNWSYHFRDGKLDLRINGKRYLGSPIVIDLVKDDEGYRVTGIEIQADNNEQIASVRLNELQ